MKATRLSAAALCASGIAAVIAPDSVARALRLSPIDRRGIVETRAGLGGTYVALGAWAIVSPSRTARRAVGVTWLGAAATRLAALRIDEPQTDATYWAYLSAELVFGALGVFAPE